MGVNKKRQSQKRDGGKIMKKRILCMLLVLTMLLASTACSNGGSSTTGDLPPTADGSERKEFVEFNSDMAYWINYLSTWGTDGPCIIIDGLVDFDKYGVVVPAMATEWTKSEDGLTYTYKLREGAKWYDYKGEEYCEVTADDFVAGLKYTLTADNECSTANLVYDYVENAKAYYDGEITDFSQVGVKAIDKYTVEYKLIKPCPYFLKLSGYNCYYPVSQKYLDEVGDKFGTTNEYVLYNGAYFCTQILPEDRAEFTINPHYWDVENIYISKITQRYTKDNSIAGEMFQRGELTRAGIVPELKKEWVEDENGKGLWAQKSPYDANAWFYCFNFEPTYEGYNVEDYKVAVNNRNFRKSVFHALDRVATCYTMELWNPEAKVMRTLTPEGMLNINGVDYTQMGSLKEISNTEAFNPELAKEFKEAAVKELDGKVTFPIQLYMPYNTESTNEVQYAQLFEQGVENILGKDYVDVVLEAYAPKSFNTLTRSAGNYSIMMTRWGADYADPGSYTDPFNPEVGIGAKWNRPYLATEYLDENGVSEYVKLMQAGLDERLDLQKRYELLAEAEAFLINEAMVLPTFHGSGGWSLSKLEPFSAHCGQFGQDYDILKGAKIMDEPMTREELEAAEKQYIQEREEALKNAKNQG